ncbi:MAG: hypothetical protein ACFNL8_08780, partial [Streptococcus mutans]
MSRIGNKIITLPAGVEVTNKDKKQRELDGSSTDIELKPKFRISKRYSNKSIAITLSSTFLS